MPYNIKMLSRSIIFYQLKWFFYLIQYTWMRNHNYMRNFELKLSYHHGNSRTIKAFDSYTKGRRFTLSQCIWFKPNNKKCLERLLERDPNLVCMGLGSIASRERLATHWSVSSLDRVHWVKYSHRVVCISIVELVIIHHEKGSNMI